MDMKKIMLVFGTRPEAIKMAPLVKELQKEKRFDVKVCVTAQHREMLDMVLDLFEITPDFDLDIMKHGQTISDITCRVIKGMEEVFSKEKPDILLVHGDTTTTFAASLAAFYAKVPVGHVEAGLRSYDIYSPYPEEMNRRLTTCMSAINFAPTEGNKINLINESVEKNSIIITGNTVIDALLSVVDKNFKFNSKLDQIDFESKKVILLTCHRRENWGKPMQDIFTCVRDIVEENLDVEVIFPMHMNPKIRELAKEKLSDNSRIHLIEPLDYLPFANLMNKCYLIMTDSGGIQEEAPALGKPVVVLRKETERPEAVKAGTVEIAGIEYDDIKSSVESLIKDSKKYEKMSKSINPYGNGEACQKIRENLIKLFFELK